MRNLNKKIFLILAIAFVTLALMLSIINKNKWVKLNNKIYVKINYIQKIDNSLFCKWFRNYEKNQNNYEEVKYCAICNETKYLDIAHFKKYQNGILVIDEINNHNISAEFSAYADGEIYYNAICNTEKY